MQITKKRAAISLALVSSEAMAKITLPPLPDQASDQPIVNIQLSWSPKSKDTMKLVQLLHSSMIAK